jgi:hypothetical protein
MLKSKYQIKDDWNPKQSKEAKEKRQTNNLSPLAEYQEDVAVEDLLSWLD